jgi:hypothetical protein
MGEMDFDQKVMVKAVDGALQESGRVAVELRAATTGGRFQVRWDSWHSLLSF